MRDARLVHMANQIAASVPSRADVPGQVALHLKSFWAPSMIDTLSRHAQQHPADLSDDVTAALAILRPVDAHSG
ncbi:MAG: formate dehydrogenase subunit delta [Actinobacteria bacterium]|nr:formate dehydrogenase subunit delta [Actinomycetota bacterium]